MPSASPSPTQTLTWVRDLDPTSFRHPDSPSTLPSSRSSPTINTTLSKRKWTTSVSLEDGEDGEDGQDGQDGNPVAPRPSRPRLTRQALKSIASNNMPRRSPTKKSTHTPTSEFDTPKPTPNVANVRRSLAEQGYHYNDTTKMQQYPAFFEEVARHLDKDRLSAMKDTSAKKFSTFLHQNAVASEQQYFNKAVPQIFTDTHTVESRKRTFDEELKHVEESYEAVDGLVYALDSLLPTHILPYAPNSSIGLTTPKPDWMFGIRTPDFPRPDEKIPEDVIPFIRLGTNMDHIFFAIENKSCEGTIEEAENQAMRTGIAFVCARRSLNRMAEETRSETKATGVPTPPSPPLSTTPAAAAAAARPPSVPAQPATADLVSTLPATPVRSIPASPSSLTTSKPDDQSYYFTCAWIPSLARIFVHWYEDFGPGQPSVYHMTRMGEFLASDDASMRRFRKLGHNIFDWGILVNQKACREVVKRILKKRQNV